MGFGSILRESGRVFPIDGGAQKENARSEYVTKVHNRDSRN